MAIIPQRDAESAVSDKKSHTGNQHSLNAPSFQRLDVVIFGMEDIEVSKFFNLE